MASVARRCASPCKCSLSLARAMEPLAWSLSPARTWWRVRTRSPVRPASRFTPASSEAGARVAVTTTLDPGSNRLRPLAGISYSARLCRPAAAAGRVARGDGRRPHVDLYTILCAERAPFRPTRRLVRIQRGGLRQFGHWSAYESAGGLRRSMRGTDRQSSPISACISRRTGAGSCWSTSRRKSGRTCGMRTSPLWATSSAAAPEI